MTAEWTTALPDWESRIRDRQSMIPCPPLFPDEATAALDIFRSLRIVDAPGSPTIGESCRPWVMEFAAAIFGSLDPEAGRRLIRYFFLLVSKKNSKSTIAAAIMLTALVRNWRMSAEFLILAPTIEIANNSFWPARDMIRADPDLNDLFLVQEHLRTIQHRNTKATLKVVAADNETVSGKKAVGVLIDELWLFGKRANAESMLREATGGLASRPEGFVIYLSTQSDDPPVGVFRQKLQEFRDIRDGVVRDNRSMGVLYEFPPTMITSGEYRDPENFYITNPNLGASVDEEFLLDEFTKAERTGQTSLIGFAAKHLNVEIGLNLRSDRWAGAEFWERQADTSLTLDAIIERSEVIIVGIDGGGLDDLFGFAALGRDKVNKNWLLWSHAWCHHGVLDRRRSIASKLREIEAAGELTIVTDKLDDISAIVAIVVRVKEAGLLGSVAIDPAGIGEFVDKMAEIDVTQENKQLIGIGQGLRLMGAIKSAERRLANGTLLHSGSNLMTWCVGNVRIEPTATGIRPTKQNAGDAKIDPWCAAMNAADQMSTNPGSPGSIYGTDDRPDGLRFI
jgi:phage terminase large subunit-like protein